MPATLDLTKHLVDDFGPVELIAVDPTPALVALINNAVNIGYREDGQTIIGKAQNRHGAQRYRWYYPDGRFTASSSTDKSADLRNAPVIIKGQRRVTVNEEGRINTYPLGSSHFSESVGVVEFTVTDGVLTNVEIIKNG